MLAASLSTDLGCLTSTAELLLGLLRQPQWGTTEKCSAVVGGEMELFLLVLDLFRGQ